MVQYIVDKTVNGTHVIHIYRGMNVIALYKKVPIFHTYKHYFCVLLFFCFASVILGDSISEALILARYGAGMVPKMFMVNAAFLLVTSLFLISFIDKMDRGLFFIVLLSIHSIVLFIVWAAIRSRYTFVTIPLFSYAYITKIFLFLIFWTLANDIADSRQAAKDFPFIAAGGTIGAICISFAIPWCLTVFDAEDLLLVWGVLSVVILILFIPIRKRFRRNFMQSADSQKHAVFNFTHLKNDLLLLKHEPLLSNMAFLYFLLFFFLLNQQYLFYDAIKARLEHAENLAGFIGYINGISMSATFLLQATIAGVIIKKAGSTRAMLLLPVFLCVIFSIVFFIGIKAGSETESVHYSSLLFRGIVASVCIRIAFFDSFFSPTFQLFFSSLPQNIRGRGKLIIEGVVKPSAMVFASFWIMIISRIISLQVNITLLWGITIAMIVQTLRIRSKYTQSLTMHLATFKTRISSDIFDISKIANKKEFFRYVMQKLEQESYEVKQYIIEILVTVAPHDAVKILSRYCRYTDNKEKAVIVAGLAKINDNNLIPLYESLMHDSDEQVIAQCINALAVYNDSDVQTQLQRYLHHPNTHIQANTIIALWKSAQTHQRHAAMTTLQSMLQSNQTAVCASALYAISAIASIHDTESLILAFYEHRKDEIVKNRILWHHFIRTISKSASFQTIDLMLRIGYVVNETKQNDIVSVIGEACTNGYAAARLISYLKCHEPVVKKLVLGVLCHKELSIDKERESLLVTIAAAEAKAAKYYWKLYQNLVYAQIEGGHFLATVLYEELIAVHEKNVLLVAGILDTSGHIKQVMRRLYHENKHIRAQALEVLDNSGNVKVNRLFLELLDLFFDAQTQNGKNGKEGGRNDIHAVYRIVDNFTSHRNDWIRHCAQYVLRQFRSMPEMKHQAG